MSGYSSIDINQIPDVTVRVTENSALLRNPDTCTYFSKFKSIIHSDAWFFSILIVSCFIIPFDGTMVLEAKDAFFVIILRSVSSIMILSIIKILSLDPFQPYLSIIFLISCLVFLPKQIIQYIEFLKK
jgi:hypothetical protein